MNDDEFDEQAAANVARYRGLFEIPMVVADIPGVTSLSRELRDVIEKRRASGPAAQRSNHGGWQSDIDMLQWGGDAARQLGILILQMCGKHTTDIGQRDAQKPRFQWSADMWANVCPPGGSHESHTHPGALWSAVFYVDDGLAEGEDDSSAGQLVLQDPRNPLPVMYKPDLRFVNDNGEVYRSDHRFTPRAGRVVAFPSWVPHWVTPHNGSRERVSIAINLTILPAPE